MGFHEVSFDAGVGYSTSSWPAHNTAIVEVDGGAEERVGRWGSARRTFKIVWKEKVAASVAAMIAFVRAREGSAHGFRVKDWADYASTADGKVTPDGSAVVSHQNQTIATGDGVTTQFQLTKLYGDAVNPKVINITKPVASSVVIAFAGVQQTSGWTVDDTTGIVTFTTAPGVGVQIRAGFEYEVPVRFTSSTEADGQISLDNFTSSSLDDLGMIELVDEDPQPDLAFMGGAKRFGVLNDDISITANTGRVIVGEPQAAGLKVILPDAKSYGPGGPWFLIVNEGTDAWSVRNSADDEIISIPVTESAEIWMSIDSGGNKVWWAK